MRRDSAQRLVMQQNASVAEDARGLGVFFDEWARGFVHDCALNCEAVQCQRLRVASIQAANDCANFVKNSRVLWLVRFPWASKRVAALPM